MNEITIFKNADFGEVRTLTIDGKPYFVGKDVADILGYQNGSRDVIIKKEGETDAKKPEKALHLPLG